MMARGRKDKGGAVWRIWFLTVGFEELRRDAQQEVDPSWGDGVEMGGFEAHGPRGTFTRVGVVMSQKLCHWSSREATLQVIKVREVAVGKMCCLFFREIWGWRTAYIIFIFVSDNSSTLLAESALVETRESEILEVG